MLENNQRNKCNILGVDIDVTDMEATLSYLERNLEEIKGNYICISNVHTTVMSSENEYYKHIQNSGIMALPDGKPLSIVSKMRGHKNAQRVTGPDLMEEIFKLSITKGYSHFFYGSTDDTLQLLKKRIHQKYSDLIIKGMYSPPFRDLNREEDEEIIEVINKFKPDFVWVALGAPKQEIWMYNHRNEIKSLMIGVGAGFDYHAGKIKRAPKWMQDLSLEWIYRLGQEPKRLLKRYIQTNIRFVFYLLSKK